MKNPGEFWDRKYDVEHYRYGTAPNAFLSSVVELLPPGSRVLSIGDGEGRNGVFLAEQGFEVTTIEPSRIGVRKARDMAEERGVTLDIQHGCFPDDLDADNERYDAVVLMYVHLPPNRRASLHRVVVDHLASGGLVILEAFTPTQLKYESGGPGDVEMLFTPAILRTDFAALEMSVLEEAEVDLDEGPGHSGRAAVVRMVAAARS